MNALHINGNDLTLEAVREVAAERRAALLSPDARQLVNQARAVVDEIVASNKVAYAITTGVGKNLVCIVSSDGVLRTSSRIPEQTEQ